MSHYCLVSVIITRATGLFQNHTSNVLGMWDGRKHSDIVFRFSHTLVLLISFFAVLFGYICSIVEYYNSVWLDLGCSYQDNHKIGIDYCFLKRL